MLLEPQIVPGIFLDAVLLLQEPPDARVMLAVDVSAADYDD